MKRKLPVALAAMALIAGLALFFIKPAAPHNDLPPTIAGADRSNVLENTAPGGAARPNNTAAPDGADAFIAAATTAAVPVAAPVAGQTEPDWPRLPETGGYALYHGELLDMDVRALDQQGMYQRTRLLRTDFHAPLLRVEETVRFVPEQDEGLQIMHQLGMVADHVLMRVQPHISEEDLADWLAPMGYAIESRLSLPSTYRIAIPAKRVSDLPTALQQLKAAAAIVVYAEPDHVVHSTQTEPNDPAWLEGLLYGLHNTGQRNGTPGKDIGALTGWQIRKDAPDVIVGVIDTGILYTHEDLAANMWVNPNESPDGTDTDGNGYVDDIHGINAITRTGSPMDDNRHGTHCAGTIGAVGDNAIGLTGVAWNVQLMGLKFLSAHGSGITSHAAECIVYGVNHGATILSNSWGGGGYNQALVDAIELAAMADVIFVAAAGNDGNNLDPAPQYPASYPVDNIVAVASYDRTGERSRFSNFGVASVHLAAPGSNIYSATIAPNDPAITNRYEELSGTSMATPHVSGVFALMRQHFPSESAMQLINRAMAGADFSIMQGSVVAGGIHLPSALSGEPAGPFNDDWENARFLGRRSFVTFSNNTLATAQPGEPAHGGIPATHSVWFRWQAPFENVVEVFTSNAEFNSVIAVYTGDRMDNLTLVAASDATDPERDDADSFLTFNSTGNATYYIAVDSADGATGSFRLTIKNAPANDDFANAQHWTGTSGTFRADNTGATKEPGEPRHGGLWGGSSMWYRFTAPYDGRLRVGSGDGTPVTIGIGIYSGTEVSNLTELGSVRATQDSSDRSAYAIVRGGETYSIAVDTPDGQERWFFVNWAFTSNQIGFTSATTDVMENVDGGMLIIPVERFSGSANIGAASVQYRTSNAFNGAQPGIDYQPVTGSLSWAANEQGSRFISIPIIDNDLLQDDREFFVTLEQPTQGSYLLPDRHVLRVTIKDDDLQLETQPGYDSAILLPHVHMTALDVDDALWLPIHRIGATNRVESVTLTAIDGTATHGVDYLWQTGSVQFAEGQAIAWVKIPLANPTADRAFTLVLQQPSNAGTWLPPQQSSATITIAAALPKPWFAERQLLSHTPEGREWTGSRTIEHLDMSDDGRFIVFASNAQGIDSVSNNGQTDVYLRDMATGILTLVSRSLFGGAGNGESTRPSISGDGRWIVYESSASDILADDPNGHIRDIIRFDRITGSTEAVNRNSNGELAQIRYINLGHPVYVDCYDARISKDGNHVVFVSTANNLDVVHIDEWWDDSVFIRDLTTGLTETVSVGNDWLQIRQRSYAPSVSADGQRVAFISNAWLTPDDTNGDRPDVYVRNITDKTTQLVSKLHTGAAHQSWARIHRTVISGDGSKVFFASAIPGFVADDTDTHTNLFRHDLATRTTVRVDSTLTATAPGGSVLESFAVSHDGETVAFISWAADILPGDNNAAPDIFVRNLQTGLLVSPVLTADSNFMPGVDIAVAMTRNGDGLAFVSNKMNLIEPSTSGQNNLFAGPSRAGETAANIRFSQPVFTYLRTLESQQHVVITLLRSGFPGNTITVNYSTADITATASIDYQPMAGSITFGPQQFSATIEIPIFNPPGPDPVKTFRVNVSPGTGEQRIIGPQSVVVELSDAEGALGSAFRISALDGTSGNNNSRHPYLNHVGDRVAFSSFANNLSPVDTSNRRKAFLYDYLSGTLSLRAVAADGTPANGIVRNNVLSPDGDWMVFHSTARNLTADVIGSSLYHVFIEDLRTGEIVLISKNPETAALANAASNSIAFTGIAADIERPGLAVSADGAFVVFQSMATNLTSEPVTANVNNLFLWERATGAITLISKSPDGSPATGGACFNPEITPDGRFVAFLSAKHDLVADDTNAAVDVFRWERATGEIIRVNLSSDGEQARNGTSYVAAISADGDIIAFDSSADNLVDDDTNETTDIFVRSISAQTTQRVNISSEGLQARSFFNGFRMAGHSFAPSLSADGRFVVFQSDAYDLVAGIEHLSTEFNGETFTATKPNLFVHDRLTSRTRNVIAVTPTVHGRHHVISGDGRIIAFASDSSQILPEGSGDWEDVFIIPNPLFPAENPFPLHLLDRVFFRLTEVEGRWVPGLMVPLPDTSIPGSWNLLQSVDLEHPDWQPVPTGDWETVSVSGPGDFEWQLLRLQNWVPAQPALFLRAIWQSAQQ